MTRRLRVLFYIGSMDAGGAERQVVEYLTRLDRGRFEPILGLATRQGPLLAEIPRDVPIHAFQTEMKTVRRFGLGRWQRWTFLAKLLQHNQIDVVYDRTFLATLDTGPATWRRPTPRISTVVADPKVQMDLYFPRRQWLWRRFARCVYRTANVVLANSEGLRTQVIDYFRLPPDQVRVTPNVINAERIDALASNPPTDGDDHRFRILTVGRIDRHKGHRDLLEAVRLARRREDCPNILWQILGDGPERVALTDEARRLGLSEHVQWLGIVANPYPYYCAADVYCLPSWTEGSPNVLLEALCLGTPVVSTDCPSGPREILENGRWGALVPVRNPQALADAIADCWRNPERWRERATRAKSIIRQRYDVVAGVRRLEDILVSAAASRRH